MQSCNITDLKKKIKKIEDEQDERKARISAALDKLSKALLIKAVSAEEQCDVEDVESIRARLKSLKEERSKLNPEKIRARLKELRASQKNRDAMVKRLAELESRYKPEDREAKAKRLAELEARMRGGEQQAGQPTDEAPTQEEPKSEFDTLLDRARSFGDDVSKQVNNILKRKGNNQSKENKFRSLAEEVEKDNPELSSAYASIADHYKGLRSERRDVGQAPAPTKEPAPTKDTPKGFDYQGALEAGEKAFMEPETRQEFLNRVGLKAGDDKAKFDKLSENEKIDRAIENVKNAYNAGIDVFKTAYGTTEKTQQGLISKLLSEGLKDEKSPEEIEDFLKEAFFDPRAEYADLDDEIDLDSLSDEELEAMYGQGSTGGEPVSTSGEADTPEFVPVETDSEGYVYGGGDDEEDSVKLDEAKDLIDHLKRRQEAAASRRYAGAKDEHIAPFVDAIMPQIIDAIERDHRGGKRINYDVDSVKDYLSSMDDKFDVTDGKTRRELLEVSKRIKANDSLDGVNLPDEELEKISKIVDNLNKNGRVDFGYALAQKANGITPTLTNLNRGDDTPALRNRKERAHAKWGERIYDEINNIYGMPHFRSDEERFQAIRDRFKDKLDITPEQEKEFLSNNILDSIVSKSPEDIRNQITEIDSSKIDEFLGEVTDLSEASTPKEAAAYFLDKYKDDPNFAELANYLATGSATNGKHQLPPHHAIAKLIDSEEPYFDPITGEDQGRMTPIEAKLRASKSIREYVSSKFDGDLKAAHKHYSERISELESELKPISDEKESIEEETKELSKQLDKIDTKKDKEFNKFIKISSRIKRLQYAAEQGDTGYTAQTEYRTLEKRESDIRKEIGKLKEVITRSEVGKDSPEILKLNDLSSELRKVQEKKEKFRTNYILENNPKVKKALKQQAAQEEKWKALTSESQKISSEIKTKNATVSSLDAKDQDLQGKIAVYELIQSAVSNDNNFKDIASVLDIVSAVRESWPEHLRASYGDRKFDDAERLRFRLRNMSGYEHLEDVVEKLSYRSGEKPSTEFNNILSHLLGAVIKHYEITGSGSAGKKVKEAMFTKKGNYFLPKYSESDRNAIIDLAVDSMKHLGDPEDLKLRLTEGSDGLFQFLRANGERVVEGQSILNRIFHKLDSSKFNKKQRDFSNELYDTIRQTPNQKEAKKALKEKVTSLLGEDYVSDFTNKDYNKLFKEVTKDSGVQYTEIESEADKSAAAAEANTRRSTKRESTLRNLQTSKLSPQDLLNVLDDEKSGLPYVDLEKFKDIFHDIDDKPIQEHESAQSYIDAEELTPGKKYGFIDKDHLAVIKKYLKNLAMGNEDLLGELAKRGISVGTEREFSYKDLLAHARQFGTTDKSKFEDGEFYGREYHGIDPYLSKISKHSGISMDDLRTLLPETSKLSTEQYNHLDDRLHNLSSWLETGQVATRHKQVAKAKTELDRLKAKRDIQREQLDSDLISSRAFGRTESELKRAQRLYDSLSGSRTDGAGNELAVTELHHPYFRVAGAKYGSGITNNSVSSESPDLDKKKAALDFLHATALEQYHTIHPHRDAVLSNAERFFSDKKSVLTPLSKVFSSLANGSKVDTSDLVQSGLFGNFPGVDLDKIKNRVINDLDSELGDNIASSVASESDLDDYVDDLDSASAQTMRSEYSFPVDKNFLDSLLRMQVIKEILSSKDVKIPVKKKLESEYMSLRSTFKSRSEKVREAISKLTEHEKILPEYMTKPPRERSVAPTRSLRKLESYSKELEDIRSDLNKLKENRDKEVAEKTTQYSGRGGYLGTGEYSPEDIETYSAWGEDSGYGGLGQDLLEGEYGSENTDEIDILEAREAEILKKIKRERKKAGLKSSKKTLTPEDVESAYKAELEKLKWTPEKKFEVGEEFADKMINLMSSEFADSNREQLSNNPIYHNQARNAGYSPDWAKKATATLKKLGHKGIVKGLASLGVSLEKSVKIAELVKGLAMRDNSIYLDSNLFKADFKNATEEKNFQKKEFERTRGGVGPMITPEDDDEILKAVAEKTNPELWERAKREAKAKMGGKHSARAMQLAVKIYKEKGGGYKGKKPSSKSNSLKKWTKQDWRWSKKDKGVYLPKEKISKLKSSEEGKKKLKSAERKKSKATKEGKQYSKHGLAAGTSMKKSTGLFVRL